MITGFAAVKQNGSTQYGLVKLSDNNLTGDEMVSEIQAQIDSIDLERIVIMGIEEVVYQYDNIAYLTNAE